MKFRLIAAIFFTVQCSAGFAATCSADIDSTDQMQFDKKSIEVPASCKKFTVNLRHVGKLPRNVMGHNWVLTETADMKGAGADGIAAGVINNYVKPGDTRVLAATKILGGGESDAVTFDTSKLKQGREYSYFCSFPGHASLMVGRLTLNR